MRPHHRALVLCPCVVAAAVAAVAASQPARSPYLLMVQALQLDSDQAAAVARVPVRTVVTREELNDDDRPVGPAVESDDPERDELDFSVQKMFVPGRYRYDYRGLSDLAGAPVYLVGFVPDVAANQPRPAASASRTERLLQEVLNGSIGEVYVDQRTGGIARFESHLTHPIGYLTASVSLADVTYEQQLVSQLWMPRRAVIYLHYTYFLGVGGNHRRFTVSFVPPRVPARRD